MQRGPSRIDADEVLMSDGCRQIISDNGFDDKITLIHGKVEDVELPVPKVDCLPSRPHPCSANAGAHCGVRLWRVIISSNVARDISGRGFGELWREA